MLFDKVIQLAPYLHFGYAGKAKAAFELGYVSESEALFEQALARTHDDKTEDLYRAKLAILEAN